MLTSDAVDKLIDKYTSDIYKLNERISSCATYVAAISEDEKSLAPEFDFMATVNQIEELESKIITLKHARNAFNNSTEVVAGVTVDQALIKMAMLNKKKNTYINLAGRLPKERVHSRLTTAKEIEYTYVNYNIEDAQQKADEIESELSRLRQPLNIVNSTKTFEVDIEV